MFTLTKSRFLHALIKRPLKVSTGVLYNYASQKNYLCTISTSAYVGTSHVVHENVILYVGIVLFTGFYSLRSTILLLAIY